VVGARQSGHPDVRSDVRAINRGKQVVQENVLASLDGSLANVFVRLQGTFAPTPVPNEPVTIDQRGCVYVPRVMGIRVGQTLQVRNDDELLHNVHSLSVKSNTFNVSEPKAGMVQQFKMKDEEVMLRIKCDVHSWMTTYVGVVSNPYFAVRTRPFRDRERAARYLHDSRLARTIRSGDEVGDRQGGRGGDGRLRVHRQGNGTARLSHSAAICTSAPPPLRPTASRARIGSHCPTSAERSGQFA
jgi:plastocyanin